MIPILIGIFNEDAPRNGDVYVVVVSQPAQPLPPLLPPTPTPTPTLLSKGGKNVLDAVDGVDVDENKGVGVKLSSVELSERDAMDVEVMSDHGVGDTSLTSLPVIRQHKTHGK